jgi:signal transduction histidine kinase/CheY-like chemotaxis protein
MHWNSIPEALVMGIVVLVFLSIYRKRQSACTWNWIAGWIFVAVHFLCRALTPGTEGWALAFFDILGDSTLVISGMLFFLATIELNKDFKTQRIPAFVVVVTFVLYIAIAEVFPRPILLETIVVAESAGVFALWFRFLRLQRYSSIVLASAVFACGWSFWSVLRGDLGTPVVIGLTGIYCATALSYWRRFQRASLGVIIAVAGFLAWGAVFTVGEVLEFFHPGLIPATSGIWNIPKYFVAGAMILTLLEDEIIAAKRLMRRYRLQFDRSLCGVYRCSAQGKILECNDAFVQIFQRGREEILATDLADLLGGNHGSGGDFIEQLTRQPHVMGMEFAITTAAGAPRYLIGNASLVPESQYGPSEIQGTLLDMTDFKILQDQIRDSQKLEALGLLAGGVAHDFNNLLMVISGHMELLEVLNSDPQTRAAMDAVKNATQRGAAITGQLLAFSRKRPTEPKLLDINSVLKAACNLFVPVLGENVTLEVRAGEGKFDVLADENQMTLVLLNMVINARDAMPDGGRVLLESSTVELDESLAKVHGLARSGQYVCISVSDTGCGIPSEIRARVFEPFFTTKPQGKGTGLGLSICFGIIQQHHGTITIASSPGIGTTVSFYLPMAMSGTSPALEPYPKRVGLKNARILLVDDEELLRKPACAYLQQAGFQIAEASSSDEALRMFHEQMFDLVITDMVMPGMNGKQLGEELKKLSPNIPIIYVSGYAQDILERQGQLGADDILLQKPYSLKHLVQLATEELDKRSRYNSTAAAV